MLARPPPVPSAATASRGLSSSHACGVCRPGQSAVSSNGSLQRKTSMDTGLQRQFSGSTQVALQRRASTQMHALGPLVEAAPAQGMMDIVSGCILRNFTHACRQHAYPVCKATTASAASAGCRWHCRLVHCVIKSRRYTIGLTVPQCSSLHVVFCLHSSLGLGTYLLTDTHTKFSPLPLKQETHSCAPVDLFTTLNLLPSCPAICQCCSVSRTRTCS